MKLPLNNSLRLYSTLPPVETQALPSFKNLNLHSTPNSKFNSTIPGPPRTKLYYRLLKGLESGKHDPIVVYRLSFIEGWTDLCEKAIEKLGSDLKSMRRTAGFLPPPTMPLPALPSSNISLSSGSPPTPVFITATSSISRASSSASIYSNKSSSDAPVSIPGSPFPSPTLPIDDSETVTSLTISEESFLVFGESSEDLNSHFQGVGTDIMKEEENMDKEGDSISIGRPRNSSGAASTLLEIIQDHSPPKNLNSLRKAGHRLLAARRKSSLTAGPAINPRLAGPPKFIRKVSIPLPVLPFFPILPSIDTTSYSFPSPPSTSQSPKRQSLVSFSPIHLSPSSTQTNFSNPVGSTIARKETDRKSRTPSPPLIKQKEKEKEKLKRKEGFVGFIQSCGDSLGKERNANLSGSGWC